MSQIGETLLRFCKGKPAFETDWNEFTAAGTVFLLVIENRTAASMLCAMCDEVHMYVVLLTYRAPYLR